LFIYSIGNKAPLLPVPLPLVHIGSPQEAAACDVNKPMKEPNYHVIGWHYCSGITVVGRIALRKIEYNDLTTNLQTTLTEKLVH
jgi:hypothetical protein